MGQVTKRMVAAPTASPKLIDLLPSFQRHLRAENKSPRTVQSYTEAVRRLHDFLTERGMPVAVASITREHVDAFMEDQLALLAASSTRSRYASCGRASREGVQHPTPSHVEVTPFTYRI
jgi:hypothetical protein